MDRLYLVPDGGEIARRRRLLPAGTYVEAWPDVAIPDHAWVSGETRAVLDAAGAALPAALSVDAGTVAIYYGPHLGDVGSLPAEASLRTRVLSAHGIAVAWVTRDQLGLPLEAQPSVDPVFVLRRPGGTVAHRWRLFRARPEATLFMREFYGSDPEARAWAEGLVEDYDDLLRRHGRREQGPVP